MTQVERRGRHRAVVLVAMAALALGVGCADKPSDGDDDAGTDWSIGGGSSTIEDPGSGVDTADPADFGDPVDTGDTSDPGSPAHWSECRAADGFATTLEGARIDGDELQLSVSYSGGCAEHVFTLCWPDGTFIETAPVQARLELLHGGEPDPCEAWVNDLVTVDLVPLREAYSAAYATDSGEIILELGTESVSYTF